jgi:hypothetical protein
MSVARCGLHLATTPSPSTPAETKTATPRTTGTSTTDRATTSVAPRSAPARTAPSAGNGDRPRPNARVRVRELVSRERQGGARVTVTEVTAVTGLKRRRAYELLHQARAE